MDLNSVRSDIFNAAKNQTLNNTLDEQKKKDKEKDAENEKRINKLAKVLPLKKIMNKDNKSVANEISKLGNEAAGDTAKEGTQDAGGDAKAAGPAVSAGK